MYNFLTSRSRTIVALAVVAAICAGGFVRAARADTSSGCGLGSGGAGLNDTYPTSSIKTIDDAKAAAATSYGSGQCVALTQALSSGTPASSLWTKSVQVQGDGDIPVGTPIATFNYAGQSGTNGYGPASDPGGVSGESHTGIYLGQDSNGIWILDQWLGHAASIRQIGWADASGNCSGMSSSDECANKYYVIANAGGLSGSSTSSSGGVSSGTDDGGSSVVISTAGASCDVPSTTGSGTINLGSGASSSSASSSSGLSGTSASSFMPSGLSGIAGGSVTSSSGSLEVKRLEGTNF